VSDQYAAACDDVVQMTAKILSFLGFGRAPAPAPQAPVDTPVEELDVGRLTECSICTELMTNPKFLPCHHTFCCGCIRLLCQSQSGTTSVPCPMCRSPFKAPSGLDAATFPTNAYVEELVRVSGMMQKAAKARDELAATRTKLQASEDWGRKAAEEKRRQDMELANTKRKMAHLKDFSSRLKSLKKKMSYTELCEVCLLEREKDRLEELKAMEILYEEAKNETERCRKSQKEADASLATAMESSQSLSKELKQTQRESSELTTKLEKSKAEVECLKIQLANTNKQWLRVLVMVAVIVYVLSFVAKNNVSILHYSRTVTFI